MSSYKRSGNKWSVNEILSLQREYELLEMNILDIAMKHQRSVISILYKLESEGFIDSWYSARGFNEWSLSNENKDTFMLNSEESNVSEDDTSAVDKLVDRVWNLETTVSDISSMVKQMFNAMAESKASKKRQPLRKL